MTWQDRISDAVLETAAGSRFVFEYKDLGLSRKERAEIFEFSNTQDYVQRRVSGSEVFEWALWFSGPDCDTLAETFEKATQDNRPMILQHPLKKKTYLVQLLSLQRNDNLRSSANEVAFTLVLHETIDLQNIVKPENVARFVDNTVNRLNLANSDWFANQIKTKSPSALDKIKKGMKTAVAAVAKAAYAYSYAAKTLAQLNSIVATAESLVTTLETNAKAFADLQQGFIQFMANAIIDPRDRIKFYRESADDFLAAALDPLRDPLEIQLNLFATITGLAKASITADSDVYITKIATFEQAEFVYKNYFFLVDFSEEYDENQEPEQAELINQIVSTAAGRLSEIAFRAKQERSIVVTREEEIYSLVYRLAGGETPEELDRKIDEFIEVNELAGRELFEINPGRLLRFYL